MKDDSHRHRKLEKSSDVLKGAGHGRRVGTGNRYAINTSPGGTKPKSTAIVMDMGLREPVIRFDRPHHGAEFPHININPKVSGRLDPHYWVPLAVVEAAPKVGKFLKYADRVLIPLAMAMDAYLLYSACKDDSESGGHGYSRTVTAVGGIAGGWGGSFAGGAAGAAAGTLICPGIGSIVGSIIGGIAGAFLGDVIVQALIQWIRS